MRKPQERPAIMTVSRRKAFFAAAFLPQNCFCRCISAAKLLLPLLFCRKPAIKKEIFF